MPSGSAELEIERGRTQLYIQLLELRKYQHEHFILLRHKLSQVLFDDVENANLQLPSGFTHAERIEYGLEALGECEYALREGEAYDAIRSLRESIKERYVSIKHKQAHIRGQKDNTRAQRLLQRREEDNRQIAGKYNDARDALLRLGLDPTRTPLLPLSNDDLHMLDPTKPREFVRNGKKIVRKDPWFWVMGGLGKDGTELAKWSEEGT